MAKNKELNTDLTRLKLDLIDRLGNCSLDYSLLREHETELEEIVEMPPERRAAQFNQFINKIRSKCVKPDK